MSQMRRTLFAATMLPTTWALSLLVLLSLCASTSHAAGPATQPVVFCIMGDVPYKAGEEILLAKQLTELPADCRYVFHVGDIQSGPVAPVTEDRYKQVAGILKQSPKQVFIVPGDNEWNDAPNVDEAWTFWMRNLYRLDESWKTTLNVERQKERVENLAFVDGGVLFVGLNLVGGRVHDAAEWKMRHQQNVDWINAQFTRHMDDVGAAVIFAQANPAKPHQDFVDGLVKAANTFKKPVLFLHGDGHKWLKDVPFAAKNILRVQVDMGGIAPPLKVTVQPDAAEPFAFDRRLPDRRHLTYMKWTGMSPGGGFTQTTLTCVEVDFAANRQRAIVRQAEAPQPMLPGDEAEIRTLLGKEAWAPLAPARATQLTAALAAWQATKPPAAYAGPQIGMEDGALEKLSVEGEPGSRTTAIDFRAQPTTPAPPAAWQELVRTLVNP